MMMTVVQDFKGFFSFQYDVCLIVSFLMKCFTTDISNTYGAGSPHTDPLIAGGDFIMDQSGLPDGSVDQSDCLKCSVLQGLFLRMRLIYYKNKCKTLSSLNSKRQKDN